MKVILGYLFCIIGFILGLISIKAFFNGIKLVFGKPEVDIDNLIYSIGYKMSGLVFSFILGLLTYWIFKKAVKLINKGRDE